MFSKKTNKVQELLAQKDEALGIFKTALSKLEKVNANLFGEMSTLRDEIKSREEMLLELDAIKESTEDNITKIKTLL